MEIVATGCRALIAHLPLRSDDSRVAFLRAIVEQAIEAGLPGNRAADAINPARFAVLILAGKAPPIQPNQPHQIRGAALGDLLKYAAPPSASIEASIAQLTAEKERRAEFSGRAMDEEGSRVGKAVAAVTAFNERRTTSEADFAAALVTAREDLEGRAGDAGEGE